MLLLLLYCCPYHSTVHFSLIASNQSEQRIYDVHIIMMDKVELMMMMILFNNRKNNYYFFTMVFLIPLQLSGYFNQ